jgi:hypothetical protein
MGVGVSGCRVVMVVRLPWFKLNLESIRNAAGYWLLAACKSQITIHKSIRNAAGDWLLVACNFEIPQIRGYLSDPCHPCTIPIRNPQFEIRNSLITLDDDEVNGFTIFKNR